MILPSDFEKRIELGGLAQPSSAVPVPLPDCHQQKVGCVTLLWRGSLSMALMQASAAAAVVGEKGSKLGRI
jgi:hypothetical protein